MMDEGSSGYRMFWTQLLDKARERTDLHARLRPGTAWYMGVNQGGITYNYALRKDSAYVELWIDKGFVEINEALFQMLLQHRDEIQEAFDGSLVWHKARGRSRAIQHFVSEGGFDDRSLWPQIQDALIDAMIQLEACCGPWLFGAQSTVKLPPSGAVRYLANATEPSRVPLTAGRAGEGEIVNLTNLKAGIIEFRRRWPGETDFHNQLSVELLRRRDAGQLTWGRVVDELAAWGALRSGIPGRDRSWYLEVGTEPFTRMVRIVAQIRVRHGGKDPVLTETGPEELQQLFDVAVDIKAARAPMFASKVCHFLMPSAFPVADGAVLGLSNIGEYWSYWRRCAEGWRSSDEKEVMTTELRHAMSTAPHPRYPWAAKIGELSHTGARLNPLP